MAVDEEKLIDKIINQKLICKRVQYREAILEVLQRAKKVDLIIVSEKIPGEISIEELIKKIKKINYKIIIFFILDKEDIKKENKLKKLGIKNIYIKNNKDFKKILNKLEEFEIDKTLKNTEIIDNNIKNKNIKDKIKNNIKNKRKNKINIEIKKCKNLCNYIIYIINKYKKEKNKKINNLENKIITIYGERKSGKTTISNLIIYYLINKNKKILIINLNKKIEKNYLILLGKKYYLLKNKLNKLEKNKLLKNKTKLLLKNLEIKINKNVSFIYEFSKIFYNNEEKDLSRTKENLKYFFDDYKKKYDYIIVDIGISDYSYLEEEFIRKSDKKVIVWYKNILGIQKIEDFIIKMKNIKDTKDEGLHIIHNKYYFNSISNLILKYIFKKSAHIYKISFNKNYKNLAYKISKNEKVKIKKSEKMKIEKILK